MSLDDLFERIAGMMARGVPQNQIADVVGLSEGRISQIKGEPEFQEFLAKKSAEYYDERALFDSGWDGVEQMALAKIIKRLEVSSDPDYALKCAMIANKANRRVKTPGNDPIPASIGVGVVLHLSGNFIERLQVAQINHENHVTVVQTTGEAGGPQKRVNMLEPAEVEKLFSPGGQKIVVTDEQMKDAIDTVFSPEFVPA